MMGWYHNGMGWGGWLAMVLVMVAFWALVIWALVVIFRGTEGVGDARFGEPERDALDILDERFARGEIDADEYRARAEVLRAAPH